MDQKFPKISCAIINYNGEKFINRCLKSLIEQDYSNFEIIFIDNVSTDNSVNFIKENFPQIKIIENAKNIGYTGGANQAIEITDGKYLMILNPDIVYEPDYLSKCVQKLEECSKIGVIGGKLLKYDFENNKKINLIDSIGLYCFKNRRIIDRGQGYEDKGQYNQEERVFGISGASPIYRREALLDIKIYNEIFDEDFFMYKEDIDISWRLNLRGWICYYFPKALAYQGRGTGVLKRANHLEVLKHRQKVSKLAKQLSYKNQRLMQIKNEIWPSFLLDFIYIIPKEILALGYIVLREPYVLKSVMELILKIPKALKKRKWIMENRKIDWRQMHYFLGRAKK